MGRGASAASGVVQVRLANPHGSAGASAITSVGIYPGISAEELQSLLQAALRLPPAETCAGFLVESTATGKHKRRGKIVPLSLGCQHPELLAQGVARVLLSDAAPNKLTESENASGGGAKLAVVQARLASLIAALVDESAMSKFEAAILGEMCEQRAPQILLKMQSNQLNAHQKRAYLLSLVHPPAPAVALPPPAVVIPSAPPLPVQQQANGVRSPPPVTGPVALVSSKVASIANTVFSPQVQSEIRAAAANYREQQSRLKHRTLTDARCGQLLELLGIVERLLNRHALPEEHGLYLIQLTLSENQMVLSALQSSKADGNISELEKTLQRLASVGCNPPTTPRDGKVNGSASPSRRRPAAALPKRTTGRPTQLPEQLVVAGVQAPIVRPLALLQTLYQKHMLTTLEVDILRALVKQQDSHVLRAVNAFTFSRDLLALRIALVNIVEEITMELGDDEKTQPFEPIEEIDDEDEALAAAAMAHWQQHLHQFLMHWGSNKLLRPEDVQVLGRMLAESHNLLQSAYEVYASDEDETELLDTVQRIAKLQIQARDREALQAFVALVDSHCDVLREQEKTLVKELFARKDDLVRAAWEVFEVEKNVAELGDTLLRIARFTSRKDTKVRLVEVVGEMLRRQLIQSHEADGLIQLYETRNEAMLAANEAFEADGDVKELVETLLLVVKHADFGGPPRCTSPRGTNVKTVAPLAPGSEALAVSKLIRTLSAAGKLSSWQMDILNALVASHDDRLLAAVDLYHEDRNVHELVDTVWRLCELVAWQTNKHMIVKDWVIPLEKAGRISSRHVLAKLTNERDDRVMAALVVFLGDHDGDEFADTLERISRLACLDQKKNPKYSDAEDDSAFDERKVFSILEALSVNGYLTSEELAVVKALLSTRDARVLAAFDVFDSARDPADLADTLQRIVATASTRANKQKRVTSAAVMEKQLLHFASELALSTEELAALKRSITRNDPILEAAVEVYEMEHDEVMYMQG